MTRPVYTYWCCIIVKYLFLFFYNSQQKYEGRVWKNINLNVHINFKALKLRWIRVWARFQKVSECYNIPELQTFQTLRQQKFWVMQRQTFHIKLVFRVNLIWGHDGNLSEVLSSISIIKVIYIPDLLLTHLVDSRTLIEYGFDTFTVEAWAWTGPQ